MGKIVAIIPVRGGSKGIPRKNLVLLGGKPLLAYSIEHALETPEIDEVIVSTDSEEIARVAAEVGATVFARPDELSTDESPSEPALLHALDQLRERDGNDPELVVFLQATSPLRPTNATSKALSELRSEGADSLFSASPAHGFIWCDEKSGPSPLNYDPASRLRRQESKEYFEENGSIYIFKPHVLRDTGVRLGGKIVIYRMGFLERLQIDEVEDLELAERILPSYDTQESVITEER